jgi:hypothetical protein
MLFVLFALVPPVLVIPPVVRMIIVALARLHDAT